MIIKFLVCASVFTFGLFSPSDSSAVLQTACEQYGCKPFGPALAESPAGCSSMIPPVPGGKAELVIALVSTSGACYCPEEDPCDEVTGPDLTVCTWNGTITIDNSQGGSCLEIFPSGVRLIPGAQVVLTINFNPEHCEELSINLAAKHWQVGCPLPGIPINPLSPISCQWQFYASCADCNYPCLDQ